MRDPHEGLRKHKKDLNFKDTPTGCFFCGTEPEDSMHFFQMSFLH